MEAQIVSKTSTVLLVKFVHQALLLSLDEAITSYWLIFIYFQCVIVCNIHVSGEAE